MKKIISLFLIFIILLLTGCRENPTDLSSSTAPEVSVAEPSNEENLTLLYSSSDSFNPYAAATETNRQLCKLIYEPLIKLDDNFNVVYSLAQSISLDGKTCTVNIKNALFSDGTTLTADDIVYSFKLAKASATEYAYKLYGASSASASGQSTVVFKLSKADPYFTNVLDFPILKSGSEKRTDSDGVALPPIGSGRYMLNATTDKLLLNTKSLTNSGSYSIKEIELLNAPDSESLSHYVEVGAADIYYSDISDGNIVRMSGKKLNININHLVYLGVNHSNSLLKSTELRQAISSGLNRDEICRDGYYNNAISATGFYNPLWEPVKSVQNIETSPNQEITIENLEKIGYNSVDNSGIRKNASGQRLKFDLLVNKENQIRVSVAKLIASKLSDYGFSIRVVEKAYSEYLADLSSGNFQLYVAETAITPNMDLTNLLVKGGSAAYGIRKAEEKKTEDTDSNISDTEQAKPDAEPKQSTTIETLIDGLYSGKNTINDLASVLQTEMPFIPICYRTGVLFYNDKIENVKNCSAGDIYFSIEAYKLKN